MCPWSILAYIDLIPTKTLRTRRHNYPHFKDEDLDAEEKTVTCPGSYN